MKPDFDLGIDLNTCAIKAARRLQSLPDGKMHLIGLTKTGRRWELVILNEGSKAKVEVIE
jgi:hypothetical protein